MWNAPQWNLTFILWYTAMSESLKAFGWAILKLFPGIPTCDGRKWGSLYTPDSRRAGYKQYRTNHHLQHTAEKLYSNSWIDVPWLSVISLLSWITFKNKLRIEQVFVTIYIYWLQKNKGSTIFCIYENTLFSSNHAEQMTIYKTLNRKYSSWIHGGEHDSR